MYLIKTFGRLIADFTRDVLYHSELVNLLESNERRAYSSVLKFGMATLSDLEINHDCITADETT